MRLSSIHFVFLYEGGYLFNLGTRLAGIDSIDCLEVLFPEKERNAWYPQFAHVQTVLLHSLYNM